MNIRNKIIVALAVGGIFAGVAQAQPGYFCGDGPAMRGGTKGMRGDPAVRVEQRLNRLKTELKLTAEQEPLWQAFAEKSKAEAGKGIMAMRDLPRDLPAPERMDRMTQLMKDRLAAMESVNESFKRLYAVLTPEQKRVADLQAPPMGHRGGKGPRGPRGGPAGGAGMPPGPGAPQG